MTDRRFDVWAPAASRVELVIDGRAWSMQRDDDPERHVRGWWCAEVDGVGAGSRYGFSLDGGPLRPDPRSAWQPDGVDGLSAVVVHPSFEWTDSAWAGFTLNDGVLYELHIGTFTLDGTFDAAIERVPHLVELGVDAIEVMPIAEFSGRHGWGYDGVQLWAPHHAYGGPDGFKRLVDACHGAGLGVILDVVYNHVGPAGNYLPEFGPYFTDRHMTEWGPAMNFDGPGSDDVRTFVIDNALMWLRDYHLDGLRLDAVHAIVDTSALPILEQLAAEVDHLASAVDRAIHLIAESDRNDPRLCQNRNEGGSGLSAVWADDWHHALHTLLTGENDGYYEDYGSVDDLLVALERAWVYAGRWSPHRRRTIGRRPTGLRPQHFVVATQNHDQIGNRATGERTSMLLSRGKLKIAAALLLTSPFVVLIFQGEEWGASTPFLYFTDHAEPELGRAVSDGRRREFAAFGWDPMAVPDPQAPATFDSSKLDWAELGRSPHDDMVAWYQALIAYRRKLSPMTNRQTSGTRAMHDPVTGAIRVERADTVVLVNPGANLARVPMAADAHIALVSRADVVQEGDTLALPPESVAICRTAEPTRS